MAAPATRDTSKWIQIFRNALLPHYTKPNNPLRFVGPGVAKRTQPNPNIPDGVSHKLSQNYYYGRDGRREVTPPTVVFQGPQQRQITAGDSTDSQPAKKSFVPGVAYNWTTGKFD